MSPILQLAVSRFTFECVPETDVVFSNPFVGNTLRGALGMALRRLSCTMPPETQRCDTCMLNATCTYAVLFEPRLGGRYRTSTGQLPHSPDVPRPFVVLPPPASVRYPAGTPFTFGLTVFGDKVTYLPNFIMAFKILGEIGIGSARGRYRLSQVTDHANQVVYQDGSAACTPPAPPVLMPISSNGSHPETLSLRFVTPTRIKVGGHFKDTPQFSYVVLAAERRIRLLQQFHDPEHLNVEPLIGLRRLAEEVKLVRAQTYWVDLERTSRRQNATITLGGIVGEATYAGPHLERFIPLLQLAEVTHIGKNCAFGLGRYEIIPS